MTIDLRSDTVTKPTPAMLEAMLEAMHKANTGDDVFEEDPTVIELEQTTAKLFGKGAGLFCPSGTMTNQIAIKLLTQPGDEAICDKGSHVYYYEGGGMMSNSGISVKLIEGNRGRIKAGDVLQNINADNVHFPTTRLVVLENTVNCGGGSCYELNDIKAIAEVCKINNLLLHLDGARIFNACIAKNYSTEEIGNCFHTISVCLSKGLGAPVGSVLLGTQEHIKKARRIRKVFGGAYETLSNELKEVLESIYQHNEFSTIAEVSANLISNHLYFKTHSATNVDINEYGNFKPHGWHHYD